MVYFSTSMELIFPTQSTLTEEILYKYNITKKLAPSDVYHMLNEKPKAEDELLFCTANEITTRSVGDVVHLRAIVEFSNACE